MYHCEQDLYTNVQVFVFLNDLISGTYNYLKN